jgi:hypothetical protein
MDDLWISQSLIHDGLPCFSSFVHLGAAAGRRPIIDFKDPWPTLRSNGTYALASRKSHIINYGVDHLQVGR